VSAEPVNPFLGLLAEEDESRALVPTQVAELDHPITGGELEVLYRLGRGLARSGMFDDAKQADQAFAKLIFGRDLRLSATQAMTDIHIIDGRPEMSANLQAAKVRSSEHYEYRIVELTDEKCEIEFTLNGEVLNPNSTFSMADAVVAGLVLDDGGGGYKLAPKRSTGWIFYRRNMLFARAMSNGVAFHCPDVMNGIRVYAESEISDARRVEQADEAGTQSAAEADVTDADVVEDDTPLAVEERQELVASVEAAGVSIDMLLTAVGEDCTDNLTQSGKRAVIAELGKELAKVEVLA
jgi:hypothetical protein